MDEATWLNCTDTQPMLDFLKGKASERKLRLFAAACCRRIWHLLHEAFRHAVVTSERFADRLADDREKMEAYREAILRQQIQRREQFSAAYAGRAAIFALTTSDSEYPASYRASRTSNEVAWIISWSEELHSPVGSSDDALQQIAQRELQMHAHLLRDLFGNPFRAITVAPTWRTLTVTTLATAAYEERALPTGTLDADRLAVLADALEDAGCTDEQLLVHLRETSPHVRGCWVIDLLLGKE